MVPRDRIELPTRGFSVYLNDFYGFLYLFMMFPIVHNFTGLRSIIIVSCYIIFCPIFGYYGSKMVATESEFCV
jgi:hypothetical protein